MCMRTTSYHMFNLQDSCTWCHGLGLLSFLLLVCKFSPDVSCFHIHFLPLSFSHFFPVNLSLNLLISLCHFLCSVLQRQSCVYCVPPVPACVPTTSLVCTHLLYLLTLRFAPICSPCFCYLLCLGVFLVYPLSDNLSWYWVCECVWKLC